LPSLQDPSGRLRHAVDAPVGVAVLVADGDREPAVVGTDHLKTMLEMINSGIVSRKINFNMFY
jgi:hypothetical protein